MSATLRLDLDFDVLRLAEREAQARHTTLPEVVANQVRVMARNWQDSRRLLRQSTGVQVRDGNSQFAFDGGEALGGGYFGASQFADIETVDGGALFGADLGQRDVQPQFAQGVGKGIEEADAVLGFDVDDGARVRALVVEVDA